MTRGIRFIYLRNNRVTRDMTGLNRKGQKERQEVRGEGGKTKEEKEVN